MRPRITSSQSCARVCSRFSRSAADGGRMNTLTTSARAFSRNCWVPCQSMSNSTSCPADKRRFDRRPRRAVAIVEHGGPFEQFVALDHLLEAWLDRRTDSRGRRLRRAASAAWSPIPTFSGRASARSSSRDSVVLPAPDGEDSTNISPRRSTVIAVTVEPPCVTPDSEPARGIARPRSSFRARYWSIRYRSTWSSRY